MREWLWQELGPHRSDIAEAYLFGSVLDPGRAPRDIDLVLVTTDGAGKPAWQRVRNVRDITVPRFLARFGIPLSVLILTPLEWRELDGLIVRDREALWRTS